MAGDGFTWVPLESNPDVLNEFMGKLGVSKEWKVHDVLGLDDELLAMLPKEIAGMILLFPLTSSAGQRLGGDTEAEYKEAEGVFFMKQTIQNACGTIALLHVIGNNRDKIQLSPGSPLAEFFNKTSGQSSEECGKVLESTGTISEAHAASASEGQTAVPTEPVIHHFISFVNNDGNLYELDGRKMGPIPHCPTSKETFVKDAAKVCQKIIATDPNEQRFSVIAIGKDA
ncbi:unnamed protein product [Cyprideis torosa]|uniref:Ubiquitin carboxyl-terminal hydrolase n=1 Tax=Cyprideis torosa TaxID=163714 RepID=A0A7R8WEH2_9CRUS|nr:unnamed protein product [Cyprideis torosa]CAG0894346.1 unnamed protein product [Cyprideis torosa]